MPGLLKLARTRVRVIATRSAIASALQAKRIRARAWSDFERRAHADIWLEEDDGSMETIACDVACRYCESWAWQAR